MHPANTPEGPLTPALVFDLLFAYQRTAALKAAIDLDVFRAVGQGPQGLVYHAGRSGTMNLQIVDFRLQIRVTA